MSESGVSADDPYVGRRLTASRHHRHTGAFQRMSSDCAAQAPTADQLAQNQGLVFPLYLPLGDELDQSPVRRQFFGYK